MSGVNQHYLPQFLMRGFAVRAGTERSPIFKAVEHHRLRGVMDPRNIKSIGAQRNFYGKDGPGTVDDAIDRFENSLAPVIQQLNVGAELALGNVAQIASLVAHLITRAKQMRSFLEEAFREGGELIRDFARDERTIERFVRRMDDVMLERIIREDAPRYGLVLPSGPIDVIKDYVRAELHRRGADPSLRTQLSELLERVADNLHFEAASRSEEIHNRVLGEKVDPDVRVAEFLRLTWAVAHFPGEALILPDIPIVTFSDEKKAVSPIVRKDDPPTLVILPISTERALIGSAVEGWLPTALEINQAGASFAREFFVARQATDDTQALVSKIGTAPTVFDDPEWAATKQNALNNWPAG